ncbi:MAG TPA: ATP-binding protein [Candidatus Saccharimonadales bacterium]|nr:ATP-binding protein [Candidatus Saccharimonadales bacterium]
MKHAESRHEHTKTSAEDAVSSSIHYGIMGLALGLFCTLLIWQTFQDRPAAFDLRFNPFAILSSVSLISSLVAFGFIVRIKRRTTTLMWFSAFLLSIIMWAAGEVMTRLSATPEAAVIWAGTTTPGSVFMPVTLYMFVLTYTNSKHSLGPVTLPALLGVASVLTYIDQHANLLTNYDPAHFTATPWGYVTSAGPAFALVTLWAVFLPAAAIGHLYRFKRRTFDPTLRKQASLFIMAIIIPLIGGALTDGILPLFNPKLLPPLSVLLLTVMGVTITFGIIRYRFFSFTPGTIADQILDTMNEAVIGLQPNLHISYVNTGAEQLFGLSAAKLMDMQISDFLEQPMKPAALREELHKAMGNKDLAIIEEVRLRIANRPSIVTTKASITRLKDDNQPYGYLVVMTDITTLADAATIIEHQVEERTRQLHEAQAKLRASIEALTLGFALVDEHNNLVVQNKALESIFDLSKPVSTIGQLDEKLSGFDLASYCEAVRKKGDSNEVKEVGMGPKVLHIFIAPVKVTERGKAATIGSVILVQDITEEKVLTRSKDEFFSIASHELRTPLTAIRGNASIMLDYYKDVLDKDPAFREMVTDIHTSSVRLIEIVSDFLDVSRIEQGKMVFRFEPVQVDKIIELIFYEMHGLIQEKSIKLGTNTMTLGKLPAVWADKQRVTQVLYNLIGNAVKFTDKGGVSLEVTHDARMLYLRVADTGRGIAVENQKLLFHKFQQASDSLLTRDTTRGTGLGLYISRLIAKSMKGSLKLEKSEEGVGSTFVLAIPIASKRQVSSVPPAQSTGEIDAAAGAEQSS